jgi:AraC-like DNA-binding protein
MSEPTFDYSEIANFAHYYARRYYPFAFRQWREDAVQVVALAVAQVQYCQVAEIARIVSREMKRLERDLGAKRESYPGAATAIRSARCRRKWDAQKLRAAGLTVAETAKRTGLSEIRVTHLTGSSNTPEQVRARRSEGGKKGGPLGATARWPGWEGRRQSARDMRAAGSTLKQIADELGYKSESAAHYAVKGTQ